MATPSERKALLFFALVLALGAGVRLTRASPALARPDSLGDSSFGTHRSAVNAALRARQSRDSAKRRARSPRPRRNRETAVTTPSRVATSPLEVRTLGRSSIEGSALAPIDVDRASAAELDRLPGVGPSLARRIVANRDSLGPFGSMEALEEVKGIGPALAERLRPRVTFSGPGRPRSAIAGATSRTTRTGVRHRDPRP
jgi:competence ComEA-like helix-hairpin-helix protein